METQTRTSPVTSDLAHRSSTTSALASMRAVMTLLPTTLIERPNEPVFGAIERARQLLRQARAQSCCFSDVFASFDESEFEQFERRISALYEAEQLFCDAVGRERAAALDEALSLAQRHKADLVLAARYGFRHLPDLRERASQARGAAPIEETIAQIEGLLETFRDHATLLSQSVVWAETDVERSQRQIATLRALSEETFGRASAMVIDERNRAWTLFSWAREQFASMWRCVGELHPDVEG